MGWIDLEVSESISFAEHLHPKDALSMRSGGRNLGQKDEIQIFFCV